MKTMILSAVASTLVVSPIAAEQLDLVFDPTRTVIEFTLDATMHKVRGTFQLASGTVRYDPGTGTASGTVLVDARSGQSGNRRRDRDMHHTVLESETFPTIALVPERVTGELPSSGSGDMTLVGWLELGAGRHAVQIPLAVTVTGDQLEISGRFDVPYVQWGLEDPSKFVLRVAEEVTVQVTAHATVTRAEDAGEI